MPLTWGNVTVASRIMLPTYATLTAIVGTVYLTDPLHRLDYVHALSAPRMLMPMWLWGLAFLTISAVMLTALAAKKRARFVFALYLCATTFFLWGCMYAWSIFLDERVSLLAPIYPWFVVICCRASAKSLLRGEV